MKLKNKKEIKLNFLNYFLNINFFYKLYFFFTIICFIFFSFIFLQSGFWEKNKNEFLRKINLNGIVNYLHLPEIFYYKINSIFEKQKQINLDINQKNLIIIENNRKQVLKFSKQSIPFENAEGFIQSNNKRLKLDIRLKGDRKIHFQDRENSSYRVYIKRGEVFDEMRKFSIQKPRIRNYLHEWVFHELLGLGGLAKIKYNFYDFYLNGKYLGYYSLEESFGKVLLERNKRRNGPIFGVDEDVETRGNKIKYEVYNKRYWEKSENLFLVKSAIQKLDNYFLGNEPLENVFDIDKWAWFFAVTDLTYTYHGMKTESVKLYYNPINGKFEPIGFDGHRLLPNYSSYVLSSLPAFNETNFSKAKKKNSENKNLRSLHSVEKDFFFQKGKLNENFFQSYVEAINQISSEKFLDEFFKSRKKKIRKINSGIYSDSYLYDYNSKRNSGIGIYYFKKEDIYRRAKFLLNEFSIKKTKLYIEETKNKLAFSSYDENNIFLTNGRVVCGENRVNLDKLRLNKKLVFYKKNKIYDSSCKTVIFLDNISGKFVDFKINKYNSYEKPIKPSENNFLDFFEKKNNQLFLKNRTTKINKNLFIPSGYEVVIKGGQEIILQNNSFIFSNSNWKIGSESEKTFIRGSEENLGGGIIIYDNKKKSYIVNCQFEYLTGLIKNEISNYNNFYKERLIMGSVNFFQTDVKMKNIIFKNIFSEDALNIVSSNYFISESYFENIKSDAIDIDFSDGQIVKSNFLNIQNDAIDFSGSNSKVSIINFKNVGDKGISIGENSYIKINQLKGNNSLVGIATKDGSKAFADNIVFSNIDYPFAAYQKKKEYDFGKLYIENFNLNNFKKEFINDAKSTIIDNKSNKELGINNYEIDKIIKDII